MNGSDAYALLCSLALEGGRRWGDAATDWQRDDARAFLDTSDDARRLHFQTRPRGASKTGDAAGNAVAVMLAQAPPQSRLYALASDRDQGALLIDSIRGFVSRTAELAGAFRIDSFAVTALRTGTTLEVLAADARRSGGYGHI